MMKTVAALLFLLGATNGRILVFKATECNTNLDNPANYYSEDDPNFVPDLSSAENAPGQIYLPTPNTELKINRGSAHVGAGLILNPNMEIRLDVDGAQLSFGVNNNPTVEFVGGADASDPACSIGCEQNFYEYVGASVDSALEVDLSRAEGDTSLKALESPMCNGDDVVIPRGYSVQMLAHGVHSVNSVTDERGTYPTKDMMPSTLVAETVTEDRLFVGATAFDQCRAIQYTDPSNAGACLCPSECASDLEQVDVSKTIRGQAKNLAELKIKEYELVSSQGRQVPIDFEFLHTQAIVDMEACVTLIMASNSIVNNIDGFTHSQLKSGGLSFTLDAEKFRVAGTLIDYNLVTEDQVTSGTSMSFPTDLEGMTVAELVYAATVESLVACGVSEDEKNALVDTSEIGLRQAEEVDVFIGGNMPQQDVLAMCNEMNKAQTCDHVYQYLDSNIQGLKVEERAKLIMCQNWKCVTPDEMNGEEGEGNIKTGLATTLIEAKIVYDGYYTPDAHVLAAHLNSALATFTLTSHHQCYTFENGYDVSCIGDIAQSIIDDELAKCPKNTVEDCGDAAEAAAIDTIVQITNCGVLGVHKGKDGKYTCADASDVDEATAEATTKAEEMVAASVLAIQEQCARDLASFELKVRSQGRLDNSRTNDVFVDGAGKVLEHYTALVKAKTDREALLWTGETFDEPELLEPMKDAFEDAQDEFDDAERDLQRCFEQNTPPVATTCTGESTANADDLASFAACQDPVQMINAPSGPCRNQCEAYRTTGDALSVSTNVNEIAVSENMTFGVETVANMLAEKKAELEALKSVQSDKCGVAAEYDSTECSAIDALADKTKKAVDDLEELLEKVQEQKELYEIAEPTSTTTTLDADAEGSTAGDDDEFPLIPVIAGAAVVVILCIIIVVVLMMGGSNKNNDSADRNVVAFENPMYDDPVQAGGVDPNGGEDGGLYDEPAFNSNGDVENPMYQSQEGIAEEADKANEEAQETGGGYLDVQPDDDDDDDDDEEEEEDEDEDEEEDEEEEDDDDDDEDDDDEDDDDDDDDE